MTTVKPLAPHKLYSPCEISALEFDSTDDLKEPGGLLGQDRALRAIEFGIGVERAGFNLFVMGQAGSGRHTLVKEYLARRVMQEPKPGDWVYVNNFRESHKPAALRLPAGRGITLRNDVAQLIEDLRSAIPAVFESEEYRSRARQIESEFAERHERAFAELGAEAMEKQIALLRTPSGFSFAPLKDGEVISTEDYAKLPEEDKNRIEQNMGRFHEKLEGIIRGVVQWRKEQREKLKALNREVTLFAVGHHMADLKGRYKDLERVLQYLEEMQQDVIGNTDDFLKAREAQAGPLGAEAPSFRRYQVNLLVDHQGNDGSPVIFEAHPTYQNIVGRVDHLSQFGTLVTDFGMIKPGALHRANGGYLLIDAQKLLTQPFAWEGLKRAISTGQIRIESLGELYSLVSTVSLQPEPIPLDVKVVLFGDRYIYYLLHAWDPDFPELFKVAADFEDHYDRTAENDALFARLVATIAREKGLIRFDRRAVARIIEHSARLAGESRKLSANVRAVADLMCEADHLARQAGRDRVMLADIEGAIDAARYRTDRLRERMHEAIERGTVMIDTDGARVGQINGLSVLQAGDYAFAQPARITATTRLGDGRVIDVQREVELGGAIHSKGVMILSAFLAARYSTNHPHSLSASLVFEQTYGFVEGDSASLAELCALLSSLADIPIRQSLAVTGSVNQLGEVQAIGAVNEKIEGFFDVCKTRGLTGSQGVLIPASNAADLMLRADVVAVAAEGRFHVYAVKSVDEAIEILTGVESGTADAAGRYPPETVNGRVTRRLKELAARRAAAAPPGKVSTRAERFRKK